MQAHERINFDAASATPLRPEVRRAMEPFFEEVYGNPSSVHASGRAARAALDRAEDALAAILGRANRACTFTGGATEALNLGILGTAAPTTHLVVSAIEHHAVLASAEAHAARGGSVTVVAPDREGRISPDAVLGALTPHTSLVAVMAANNEIGTIQPIREIAEMLRARGVLLLSDATAAAGAIPLGALSASADLLVLSAAKIGGPKGTGVLVVPPDLPLRPIIVGGGQQRRRRSGTENVAGIVGTVEALVLAEQLLPEEVPRISALRDLLLSLLREAVPALQLHGHPVERLPGNLHVGVPGIDAEALVLALDQRGVECSSGAACTAPMVEPSHVLRALGLPEELVRTGVRFTLPWNSTEETVRTGAARIIDAVRTLTRG